MCVDSDQGDVTGGNKARRPSDKKKRCLYAENPPNIKAPPFAGKSPSSKIEQAGATSRQITHTVSAPRPGECGGDVIPTEARKRKQLASYVTT